MTRLFANRTAVDYCIAAIVLSLLIALWIGKSIQALAEPNVSTKEYRNTSNIIREQYSTTLTKWNNLHITEYEATIKRSGWGKWKIVVRVDNAYGNTYVADVRATYSHRILHYTILEIEGAILERGPIDTVGALFDKVNSMLYCQENACEGRHYFLPAHYVIEFDQTMGYPRSFTSVSEYATVETRVEDVKILK